MRHLEITHLTEYVYREPVRFGKHLVMLRPREGPDLHIAEFRLEVEPSATLRWVRDLYGNTIGQLDFLQAGERLRILHVTEVEILADTLPNFMVDPIAQKSPFNYSADELLELAAYRVPSFPEDFPALAAWVAENVVAPGESMVTTDLLETLNTAIYETFRYQARDEQGTLTPAKLLATGAGSCRDYTQFFIEAARLLGFAARFVSGYILMGEGQHGATHAWAEVYLPGLGWRGYDPTNCKLAGSEHIPCAVAREARKASPVSGYWMGPAEAFQSLEVRVEVVEK